MTVTLSQAGVQSRPKVGMVLGSGGIKSLAAVALFEFLEEARVEVDLLVGSSGGSLMCALAGAGHTPSHIREIIGELLDRRLFARVDYRTILGMLSPRLGRFDRTSSLLKPQALQQLYRRLFRDLRLEDLRPKTVLQTTDIETGEGVVLSRGPVAEAVYASGAFFPALPPVRLEGRWLGDGVYSAPVPVMEAVKRHMDVIITLDYREGVSAPPRGFLDYFLRYIDNTHRSLSRSQMLLSIGLHHHEIVTIMVEFERSISIRDVQEVPAILEAGRRAVARSQAAILSAVHSFSASGRER
jgi:NTE family protein